MYKYFYKIGLFLWMVWSRVFYQTFFEGPTTPVRGFKDLDELNEVLSKVKWVKDGLKEAGDAWASAGRFQYLLENSEDPGSGRDCDEFAVFAFVAGRNTPGKHKMLGILTVNWLVPWFWGLTRPKGHNVCFYATEDGKLKHTGNWGVWPKEEHEGYLNAEEAALDVWRHSKAYKTKAKFLGYALWKPTDWIPETHVDKYGLES